MSIEPHVNDPPIVRGNFVLLGFLFLGLVAAGRESVDANDLTCSVEQLTFGPKHHFFGYIGHVGTIPWNQSGRYIVALETDFQDHMPDPGVAANIILIDTSHSDKGVGREGRVADIRVIDQTRAWNFQQGTMLYWSPEAPETQFFFNDRDPLTNHVFTVLYDIEKGCRIREYRNEQRPVGNSGVAQKGGKFLAINYGRLARLREVTGYPQAFDWTAGEAAPGDDGIFLVDVASGEQLLLVSYAQLRDHLPEGLRPKSGAAEPPAFFINHKLWSRDDRLIYFYCRANWDHPDRINIPFTVEADGSNLKMQKLVGGHIEWDQDGRIINHDGDLYDVSLGRVNARIEGFHTGGGDIALSPNGSLLVKGFAEAGKNRYFVFDRRNGSSCLTGGFSRGPWTDSLRVDGAPCWNRRGDEILFAAIADDEQQTRQLFLIDVKRSF